jgi:hypothetical protein
MAVAAALRLPAAPPFSCLSDSLDVGCLTASVMGTSSGPAAACCTLGAVGGSAVTGMLGTGIGCSGVRMAGAGCKDTASSALEATLGVVGEDGIGLLAGGADAAAVSFAAAAPTATALPPHGT